MSWLASRVGVPGGGAGGVTGDGVGAVVGVCAECDVSDVGGVVTVVGGVVALTGVMM